MGLLEELGAWLDQKKKNVATNARDLPGLLASLSQDVQQGAAADKSAFDASRSVMPSVREAGVREMNARGQELGGLLGAIKAFHGSPHKFDKFDLSKIGTGEGAQAYGHGLYMAESPKVAQEYAEKLTKDRNWRATDLVGADDNGYFVNTERGRKYFDGQKDALEFAQQQRENLYEASIRWPDAAREAADPLGPQHFLDWDKPLSEQPETVRNLLSMADKKASRLELQGTTPGHETTGADAYRALGMLTPEFKAGGSGAGQASEMLKRKGIPGIRYLDGGSRGAGQGTHNYVVFDDNLLEILKRNGEPVQKQGLLSREPTKFELAHAEAQRNAALPIEQGGLGLGPNNTAMERAKAMGFDTPAYHGGVGDITAFDKEWRGATTGAPSAKKAHFAATSPKVATGYSLLPEDRSVVALQRQQAQAEAAKNWDKQEELTQKIEDLVYGKRNQINQLSDDRFAAEEAYGKELDKYGVQFDYSSHRPEFGDYTQEGELIAKNARYKDAFDRAAKRVPTGEKEIAAAIETTLGKKAFSWDTVDEYKALLAELQKKDARLADYYAAMHDGRWEKMPEFQPDPQQLGLLEQAYQNARGVNNELNSMYVPEGANVMPLVVNTKGFDVKDFRGSHYRDESYNELITKANIHKKPGVVMQNTFDPGSKQYNEPTGILAIMDPTRIRSRFAAFDPKKRDSRDLLASMGLLGLLGAGAYDSDYQ